MEDIHECQCPQAGYCEFFKQEMTYDPPNWQWCQAASKHTRDEYKIACDKKRERHSFGNVRSVFITGSKLIEDCIKHFIPKIANLNFLQIPNAQTIIIIFNIIYFIIFNIIYLIIFFIKI